MESESAESAESVIEDIRTLADNIQSLLPKTSRILKDLIATIQEAEEAILNGKKTDYEIHDRIVDGMRSAIAVRDLFREFQK